MQHYTSVGFEHVVRLFFFISRILFRRINSLHPSRLVRSIAHINNCTNIAPNSRPLLGRFCFAKIHDARINIFASIDVIGIVSSMDPYLLTLLGHFDVDGYVTLDLSWGLSFSCLYD